MKAPYVSLENAEQVNEFFSQVEPNWLLMRTIHFLSGRAIKATTDYEEGAKEEIDEDLSQGKQIFLAHNHQSFYDPFVLASILQREKIFRPMRTRTVIPGKAPLFNNPYYGWVIRNGGAIPVFRKADTSGDSDDPEQNEAIKKANESQVTIMQAHMNRGLHGAIYPRGTRGKNDDQEETKRDVRNIGPIHKGIGRIACGLDNPDNVSIVAVGTVYGRDDKDIRHPKSFVTKPFSVADTVEEVVFATEENLQQAVDTAYSLVHRSDNS